MSEKKSCLLVLRVTYDPEITDPDSLASACDTLLETALSTPGVLSEYGRPQFGEFEVYNVGREASDDPYRVDFHDGTHMTVDFESLEICVCDIDGNTEDVFEPGVEGYADLLAQFDKSDWPPLKPVTLPDRTIMSECADGTHRLQLQDARGDAIHSWLPGEKDYANNRRMLIDHQ